MPKLHFVLTGAVLLHGGAQIVAAEQPPAGTNAHFEWCAKAASGSEKLKRYEGFWKLHLPENPDEYDDSLHVRLIRKCAYRLAELYAGKGDVKNTQTFLRWLETNDESLRVE